MLSFCAEQRLLSGNVRDSFVTAKLQLERSFVLTIVLSDGGQYE